MRSQQLGRALTVVLLSIAMYMYENGSQQFSEIYPEGNVTGLSLLHQCSHLLVTNVNINESTRLVNKCLECNLLFPSLFLYDSSQNVT